jgi:hypothetical protein
VPKHNGYMSVEGWLKITTSPIRETLRTRSLITFGAGGALSPPMGQLDRASPSLAR